MSKKIQILYFVDRMLKGGIQSLVIEITKHINREKFQIDFLLLDDGKEYDLEKEINELGCNVYKLENVWIKTPIDYINYYEQMKKFFKKKGKNYDIVHLHSSSKNFLVLYFAKKYGIKIRIAHSHNINFQTKNVAKRFVGDIFKYLLRKNATNFMACSKKAGVWLFGKNIEVDILRNAINIEKFKYNKTERKNIREKYNISEDDIVCGNVGRFAPQKNHEFLVDIFKEVNAKDRRYRLLLVGTGTVEEQNKLKKKVKEYEIEDSVIFAGFQEKANLYFNAMDIFVFPSKFEGLGIVVIEAQANGLTCVISNNIPEEVKISENVKAIGLNEKQKWINTILETEKNRTNNLNSINDKGYNISQEIKMLEQYYEGKVKKITDK